MQAALHTTHAHRKCAGFAQDQIMDDAEEEERGEEEEVEERGDEWEVEEGGEEREVEEGQGVSEPPPQPAVITTRINDKVT